MIAPAGISENRGLSGVLGLSVHNHRQSVIRIVGWNLFSVLSCHDGDGGSSVASAKGGVQPARHVTLAILTAELTRLKKR